MNLWLSQENSLLFTAVQARPWKTAKTRRHRLDPYWPIPEGGAWEMRSQKAPGGLCAPGEAFKACQSTLDGGAWGARSHMVPGGLCAKPEAFKACQFTLDGGAWGVRSHTAPGGLCAPGEAFKTFQFTLDDGAWGVRSHMEPHRSGTWVRPGAGNPGNPPVAPSPGLGGFGTAS